MIHKGGVNILSKLERRVIDISYKKKLSHIGSCLTAVRLIDGIFQVKGKDEPFVLSNGHAGLALYVILEKNGFGDAEELFDTHGVHPNRDVKKGIYASTGSLGHGIGIAVGMALADRSKNVYVMISDGECAEGSVWESLRIAAELRLENLRVMIAANGYGAYGKVDTEWLEMRLHSLYPSLVQRTNLYEWPDYLQGLQGHYHVLSDQEYKELTV
jgi:transketolase N-terminal domain/subunit